ncbi:Uncharacterised protein [Sphingobacterium spiritivorum]|uniref:Uncharacterized protein n=1 Tax=Sphingobacterium spiritivorum TaxID=258 RepID=A0A380CMR8_SPHSI|nr:Uncharacterised protein [Sphingobacterium spiritivorum]
MEPLKRGASGVSKPIINLNYEILYFAIINVCEIYLLYPVKNIFTYLF